MFQQAGDSRRSSARQVDLSSRTSSAAGVNRIPTPENEPEPEPEDNQDLVRMILSNIASSINTFNIVSL